MIIFLPSVSLMVILAELTTISFTIQLDAIVNKFSMERSMPWRVIRDGIERSTTNVSSFYSATLSGRT